MLNSVALLQNISTITTAITYTNKLLLVYQVFRIILKKNQIRDDFNADAGL